MSETIDVQTWIGRTMEMDDLITRHPAAGMAATFDQDTQPQDGDALQPGWHWLYFLDTSRQSNLSEDGHARRGDFLPPIDLPRRMWGGNKLVFHAPLRIGDTVKRTSEIISIDEKSGRTGSLALVQVKHSYAVDGTLCLEEWHDIVYREAAKPGQGAPRADDPPADPAWTREINPDPVMLFRYSAITFNGHRIHYDYPYVTEVEGYPGLIVHGPLTASHLLDLLRREQPDAPVKSVRFRARRPLFSDAPFQVQGKPANGGCALWAVDPSGALAMTADVEYA